MLVEKFEVKPERRPIWAWPFMSKYNGVLSSAPYRTEEVRPKSEIYSPKRDDENPRPFHMGDMASPSHNNALQFNPQLQMAIRGH